MIKEKAVEKLANLLKTVKLPRQLKIGKAVFNVKKGHDRSINNQQGELQTENYLGQELEYTITFGTEVIPISIQLYLNNRNNFRLFCFTAVFSEL